MKINRLKAARFLAGISQDEVAHSIGISQAKLSRIERGYLRPSPKEAEAIAKILGRRSEELFA